ncbi:MAG: glycosyltransferase family 1 protein [Gammaproteobacteria bacterium]|jgi:glycosyltransferase involved in cell wall biosynthesis
MTGTSIAIVTDAWAPQVNGVVKTLDATRETLARLGHEIRVLNPAEHRTIPCPSYPEIRLALLPRGKVWRQLEKLQPDHIHIATEGPLGLAARRYCLANRLAFTTSYHTQFPEYLRKRLPIPLAVSYALMRRFHGAATHVMVATESQQSLLEARGFGNIVRWSRGVDTEVFSPDNPFDLKLPRPVFAYAGRVAVEKNIEAFLDLELPGSKCVIGDGPALKQLRQKYPDVLFAGYRFGRELASYMAGADVFVFPSRTDTFGLVMIEAMACGLPVAAFPVQGPLDIVQPGETGILSEDLRAAALQALDLDRGRCREAARNYSWEAASRQFLDNLAPVNGATPTKVRSLTETG